MTIIQIDPLSNGAHRNQSGNMKAIPDGWVTISEGMKTPNFPFGDIIVSKPVFISRLDWRI